MVCYLPHLLCPLLLKKVCLQGTEPCLNFRVLLKAGPWPRSPPWPMAHKGRQQPRTQSWFSTVFCPAVHRSALGLSVQHGRWLQHFSLNNKQQNKRIEKDSNDYKNGKRTQTHRRPCCTPKPDADLCMCKELPLDKKLWKIWTGPRAVGLLLAKPWILCK